MLTCTIKHARSIAARGFSGPAFDVIRSDGETMLQALPRTAALVHAAVLSRFYAGRLKHPHQAVALRALSFATRLTQS